MKNFKNHNFEYFECLLCGEKIDFNEVKSTDEKSLETVVKYDDEGDEYFAEVEKTVCCVLDVKCKCGNSEYLAL